MNLRRTGNAIEFIDVSIGQPFFAHNKFWTRISPEVAAALSGSLHKGASCCNFAIDEEDKFVEQVECVE